MASEHDTFAKFSDSLFKVIGDDKDRKKLIENIEKEVKIGLPICMSLVMNNCEDHIKFCIAKGANPNMQISNGFAALHIASILGKKNAVNILFEMGADINLPNAIGLTSLDLVLELKNHDMVNYLLEKRAEKFVQLIYKEGFMQELSQKVPISNEYLDMIFAEGLIDGLSSEEIPLSGKENILNFS